MDMVSLPWPCNVQFNSERNWPAVPYSCNQCNMASTFWWLGATRLGIIVLIEGEKDSGGSPKAKFRDHPRAKQAMTCNLDTKQLFASARNVFYCLHRIV